MAATCEAKCVYNRITPVDGTDDHVVRCQAFDRGSVLIAVLPKSFKTGRADTSLLAHCACVFPIRKSFGSASFKK